MTEFYQTRGVVTLEEGVNFERPPRPPELVHLDNPAGDVLTDFRRTWPETVSPGTAIDRALDRMKVAGVRLLLVTDEAESVLGIVTSYDIQGELPITLVEAARATRVDITVEQVMTPRQDVRALDMLSVRDAQVGHVVATLKALEVRHLLVVEHRDPDGPQQIRGLFSASQIRRQLGWDGWDNVPVPHNLAEMIEAKG